MYSLSSSTEVNLAWVSVPVRTHTWSSPLSYGREQAGAVRALSAFRGSCESPSGLPPGHTKIGLRAQPRVQM